MSRFDPTFDGLPPSIPIFPLPGALVLPRGHLPLNIFEPRYLNMVEDALAADRMIGMIQPAGGAAGEDGEPPIYPIGCAGRITSLEETDDGRFLITLKGVARFRVSEELPTVRGYRRVRCDWSDYRDDLTPVEKVAHDRDGLIAALKTYFELQGIQANWEALAETPDERLITSLAMVCPFEPSEKQALLEARDLSERARILIALVQMAALDSNGGDGHKARQ